MYVGVAIVVINLLLFGFMLWISQENGTVVIDLNSSGILLTASAVILTATAVIVGIVSFVGFKEIMARSVKKAEEVAVGRVDQKLEEMVEPLVTRTVGEAMGMYWNAGFEVDKASEIARSYGEQSDDNDNGA